MADQAQHGFTEAPASWNIRYRVNGFDEQLTLRGESFAGIKEQVDAAREYVHKNFTPTARAASDAINTEHTPLTGDGKAVTVAAPVGYVPGAPAAAPVGFVPGVPVAPAPTTPAPTTPPKQGKVNTLTVTKLEVTPRSDGRADLKFIGIGHQRPDIIKACAPEAAVELLSATGAWTLAHFAVAGVYNVKMILEWVASEKLNSKGNPYRDIVPGSIRPA